MTITPTPIQRPHGKTLEMSPDNGLPGCGVEWTHVASHYGPAFADRIKAMRPDLLPSPELGG